MPTGTPTQQVTTLLERVQSLREHSQMREIQERKARRLHIKKLLSNKYRELDRAWSQDFQIGSRVMVKFIGETNRPSWQAQVTARLGDDGFQVKWTQADKLPPKQKIGMPYRVSSHRAPTQQYR